jgi:GH15 family glucan-1,4-alpha-glucosidase
MLAVANRGDYQIASPTFGTMLERSNIVLHQTAVEHSDTWSNRSSSRSNHRGDVEFISTQQEHNVVSAYRKLRNHRQHANCCLVGMNGSIDWYCYPPFDSPSVFGAILDDKKGGRFQISAGPDGVRHKQSYWPSTNVLVTRFLLPDGIVELEDFMPAGLPSDFEKTT